MPQDYCTFEKQPNGSWKTSCGRHFADTLLPPFDLEHDLKNPNCHHQCAQCQRRAVMGKLIASAQAHVPGALMTVNDGTTNEEVIEVLVDRLSAMQAKFPCRENSIAVTHLETALLWLNKRTADRVARKVEGKHLA